MNDQVTGVLGASSLVGRSILLVLAKSGCNVIAFSRTDRTQTDISIKWEQLHDSQITIKPIATKRIENWICAAPIWVLPQYLPMLEDRGAKRIVAISSTSVLTKQKSSDPDELKIVSKLAEAEQQLQWWCQARNIEWIILRPTLIYGYGMDKNITEIVRFIRKFKFFPIFGNASGMRQPIHAEDLAEFTARALRTVTCKNRLYTVAGTEVLSYKDMIIRIFAFLHRRPVLLPVPLWLFRLAMMLIPRYYRWSLSMAKRMNQDLQFDISDAIQDFNYRPRAFVLSADDIQDRR